MLSFAAPFDFLVIVVVDYPGDEKYLVYVVPNEDIGEAGDLQGEIPTDIGETFRYTNRTIPFSTFSTHKPYFDDTYRDDWDDVQALLVDRAAND